MEPKGDHLQYAMPVFISELLGVNFPPGQTS